LRLQEAGEGPVEQHATWTELAGDAHRLERWLDSMWLRVRVVDGNPAV
jgi:hypothetical protein